MKTWMTCLVALAAAVVVSLILIDSTVLILLCALVSLVAVGAAVLRCLDREHLRARIFRATLTPAVVFVLVAGPQIPVRLAFCIYRPQFDRIVSQIEAGSPPTTPLWIGPFRIRAVGRRGESEAVYLATNDQPYEINGFTKQAQSGHFNLWSCLPLSHGWSYIIED